MEISHHTPVLGTTWEPWSTELQNRSPWSPYALSPGSNCMSEKAPKKGGPLQGLAQLPPFLGIPSSSQSRKYLKCEGLKSFQVQCAVAKRQETASMLPRSWIHVK